MRLHLPQLRGLTAVVLGGCLLGTAVLGATLRALPVQADPMRAGAAGPAVPASADVTAVAFPAPSSGWAIGTGGSGRSAIWHTGDGGTTWQTQWQAPGKGKLVSITATDPEHAWAIFGRELLGTTDGGARWRVLATLPEQAAQVRFGTNGLGVVVVDGCLPGLGLQLSRCPGQVLVSRDGGTSWSRVLSGSMPVFAVADAHGQLWAAEPAASGDVTMLTSTDAGRSWSRLGTAKTTYQLSDEVQITLAVSGGRLAWASEYDLGSCAMHGCLTDVLSSGNDGRSWRQVNLPDKYPDYCGPAQLALAVGADGSAWVGLARNGAACSPPLGLVYRNTGHGWQQLAPWQLDGISSLDPVNAQVAYAIGGQGMLARTDDGGQHWTQVLPAPVPGGELDVVGAGMAFGAQDGDDAGAILRASGTTGWSQVSDLPGTVTQVDFPSAQDGAAISYAPDTTPGWRLWTSTDGGTSWTAGGPLPKGQQLIGPWLTATGQGLLLTDDGGEPWVPQNSGTGPVREWVTSNWGASWHQAGTLQLGKDTPDGPASFAYANGAWTGWISVVNTSFNTQLDAVSGDRLSKLPGNPPADGLQLVGPGAGFAWTINYSGHAPVLKLARTTNGGRAWQRSSMTLPASPTAPLPLVGFSSVQDGWLVAGNVTLVTSNGGQTWHAPA
jgi:photosystem II stability/assembly factor-like uncharacterized protein